MKIIRSMLEPFPDDLPGTPEQWIEIAEAYEREPVNRTNTQSNIAERGICGAFNRVKGGNALMYIRILHWHHLFDVRCGNYWFPLDRTGDLNRAQVARLIAAELRRRKKAGAK